MRKLKLQVQITLDGFIAGSNGEMDFMEMNWGNDLQNYVKEITDPVGTIVLGRKLAEGFIPYWASVASNTDNPEVEAGKKFTNTQKVVFTNTLEASNSKVVEWSNTVIASDLVKAITALKNESESKGDIIAYGGANFVSSLIKNGLIDEFHLFVNPTALGNGLPIFKELEDKQNLKLIKSMSFDCGIVVLNYKLASKK